MCWIISPNMHKSNYQWVRSHRWLSKRAESDLFKVRAWSEVCPWWAQEETIGVVIHSPVLERNRTSPHHSCRIISHDVRGRVLWACGLFPIHDTRPIPSGSSKQVLMLVRQIRGSWWIPLRPVYLLLTPFFNDTICTRRKGRAVKSTTKNYGYEKLGGVCIEYCG